MDSNIAVKANSTLVRKGYCWSVTHFVVAQNRITDHSAATTLDFLSSTVSIVSGSRSSVKSFS
jgi:hypothetical protein